MNKFDVVLLTWLNSSGNYSVLLTRLMTYGVDNSLIKGALFISIFWYLWFRKGDALTVQRTRERILCTLVAGVVAIVLARALALSLPFRLRPRFEPRLGLVFPTSGNADDVLNWSAFPSDHAVMFCALSVGIWLISWRLGVFAMLYTLLIVCVPRMYFGIHYPTDILAGLAVGVIPGLCTNIAAVRHHVGRLPMKWEAAAPGFFYAALFALCFEFSTMFDSLRSIAEAISRIASLTIAGL